MVKLIGWDFFRLNCKRKKEDVCRPLLAASIRKRATNITDEEIACSIKNCGLWECMEDATSKEAQHE